MKELMQGKVLVIAVNTNGTHIFASYEWKQDWENPEYRKAWEYAAEKTFRKLRKVNRYPITITEVEYDGKNRTKKRISRKAKTD